MEMGEESLMKCCTKQKYKYFEKKYESSWNTVKNVDTLKLGVS